MSAAELTMEEQRVALHLLSARRGVELGLPPPGRSAAMWGGVAMCLAPGTAVLLGGARPDLPPSQAAVVDGSGGFILLRLGGPGAAAALARGCRLDLHEAAFPPGAVARTPIAGVAVILYRHEGGFELLVPSSFARSFARFLEAAVPGLKESA